MATILSAIAGKVTKQVDSIPLVLPPIQDFSDGMKSKYDKVHIVEPYMERILQENKKPDFRNMYADAYMDTSATGHSLPIEAISDGYSLITQHRRGLGCCLFKPDLGEVLQQIPDEIWSSGSEFWICTMKYRGTERKETPTMWYGITYVLVV